MDDDDPRIRPEDLTDAQWGQLIERVCQESTLEAMADRQRMVAAGIIDADGNRILKVNPQPVNVSDDVAAGNSAVEVDPPIAPEDQPLHCGNR
jgi:hypothetical protein